MDLFTIGLPFIFVLAVVYGGLELAGVFKRKEINAIIGLVVAAMAVTSQEILDALNEFLPAVTMVFIIVFFVGIILNFIRKQASGIKDWTMVLVLAGLFGVFFATQGQELLKDWLPSVATENILVGAGILVVLLIFYAAYNAGKSGK